MLASGHLRTSSESVSCPSRRQPGIWSQAERPWSPAAPAAGRLLSCSGQAGEEGRGKTLTAAPGTPATGHTADLQLPSLLAPAPSAAEESSVLLRVGTFPVWHTLLKGKAWETCFTNTGSLLGHNIPFFHTFCFTAKGQSRK